MMTNTRMNNTGPERKERRAAALVCAFLSVLLLACLLTGVAAAADSEGSEGTADPVNPKVIEFAGQYGEEFIEIDYDENALFSPDATGYNLKLAQASLAMAAAAFSSPGASYAASGDEAAAKRSANLKAAYEKLEFSEMEFHNYGEPLNKTDDYVAYGIAKKEITVNDATWTLFAVQIRVSGYAGEWVSNFHIDPYPIGGVNYSEGFGKPAQEIYGKLKTEIDKISLPGEGQTTGGDQTKNVKIWISGFSRAAAVSNALAGELTRNADTLKLSKDNIYAYTFATPNDVLINSSENVETDYTNIHNTLNPCDIVPVVPMSVNLYGWNYGRYGTTHYFNYGEYDSGERTLITDKYQAITHDTYNPYTPKPDTAPLPVIFELCFSQTVSSGEYIKNFYPYVKEMMSLVFCGSRNDPKRLLHLNNNLDLLHPGDEKLAAAKEKTKEYSDENEELDDRVLSFLISRALEILWLFSDDANNAVSNRASNSSDERQGSISQFTDGTTTIGFYQDKTWDDSDRFLTTAGELADNLIAEMSALKKSGYDIKNITTITKEHYPEVYMSVLFSGIGEGRLFAEKNPALDSLHAIIYDTKGGTMLGDKYVEVLPISEKLFDLTEPEDRDGYEFSGWVNENGMTITNVDVSKPGYTRVIATWKRICQIDEDSHTAEINEGNIDTITLPDISGGSLIVNELPAPKLSDGSVSVSAVTIEYREPENLLLAAPAESSDSNLQDSDISTSAAITFSIPEETAKYLRDLSPPV